MAGAGAYEFESLDSTNSYALREFGGLPDGAVITALRQTAGRGRLDRSWLSEGKGLYFTVVVKPAAPRPEIFPCYTHLMCAAVCGALTGLGLKPGIKWPNDVLCGGAKVCGILAEAVTSGGAVKGAVIGAGINLRQAPEELAGLRAPAASLAMLGVTVTREEILGLTLEHLGRLRPPFEKAGFAAIEGIYRSYAGFIGGRASVKQEGTTLEGTAGLDKDGFLILHTEKGPVRITAGDFFTFSSGV